MFSLVCLSPVHVLSKVTLHHSRMLLTSVHGAGGGFLQDLVFPSRDLESAANKDEEIVQLFCRSHCSLGIVVL